MKSLYMNDKLKNMWKEAAMVQFKTLFWRLPGGTQENHEKPYPLSLWGGHTRQPLQCDHF
jgi:hypothetical protein